MQSLHHHTSSSANHVLADHVAPADRRASRDAARIRAASLAATLNGNQQSPDHWRALCPNHTDSHRRLYIAVNDDATVGTWCRMCDAATREPNLLTPPACWGVNRASEEDQSDSASLRSARPD